MVTRKKQNQAQQTTQITLVAVAAYALKKVQTPADYNRITQANTQADLEAAWATLTPEEQTRIHHICGSEPEPDINAIATELTSCTALLQLQALKARHGQDTVKAAWKLLSENERRRLKEICDTQPAEAAQSKNSSVSDATVNEQSALQLTQTVERVEPKPRTLFSISTDLEKLNELLDDCGDDAQQQELINQWLEQLGSERDTKLDAYAALISEMLARAAVRKAEAQRMMELAQVDENRARLLKDRLKLFFETHNLKTVETARYKLSLAKNSTRPLIVDPDISPTQLPEQFQKVSVEVNTTAIREALKQGEELPFARLGESGHHIRIK